VNLFTRFIAWLNSAETDPSWKPTGLRFTTGRDYVEKDAVRGYRRSRNRTPTGHLYRRKRKPGPTPTPAEVFKFERKERSK
jgi:hypothetical protein